MVSGLGYRGRGWIEHLACVATQNLQSMIKFSGSKLQYSLSPYSQHFRDIDLNTINVTSLWVLWGLRDG